MGSLKEALQTGGPLHALSQRKQFILHKNKLPINPHNLQLWDAHDAAIHVTADTATAMANALPGYGVGFVFTKDDPFYFLDIDKCLEPDGITWSLTALTLLAALPGAAVEVSQSGRGLHVFGRAGVMPHGNKNIALGIELYTEGRFVALTGTGAMGDANIDSTPQLAQVIQNYFPMAATAGSSVDWTDGPVSEWSGPADDQELILKARSALSTQAALGYKAAFEDLWTNNLEALGIAYPDTEGERPYDGSSADLALAVHLAFWTGKDCERIARIMRMSALTRDKWQREDYIHRTITRAVSLQTNVYNSGYRNTPPPPENLPEGVQLRDGLQFKSAVDQVAHFAGCTYVVGLHKVHCGDSPELRKRGLVGEMLNPERFRATMGGYLFSLDSINDKITKNAWEALTESQAIHHPKANAVCFRPQVAPGSLIKEEGRILLNTYMPVNVRLIEGDASLFLDLLNRLLPQQGDRDILLAYMAAVVQHPGYKFQWAPLIQGADGNGKTTFTRCLAYAVGYKYTHLPNASDIHNKFNSWREGKIFIGVEDVNSPEHKQELLEILKPMITSERMDIQAKGVDQITMDVCDNYIFNSNHKNAIRKTRTDRRFAVFFTPQQQAGDIVRDGMGGGYFPNLYDWLKGKGKYSSFGPGYGYAIVANYLHTYQIPDALNPSKSCIRAPRTSSTNEAVAVSLGGVEQEIMEAIEIGKPGFCGGWISSLELNRLLETLRMTRAIPLNKRRELLQGLGYDWHPALRDGRLNNPLEGGAKPKIFIREDHPDRNLSAPEVAAAYQNAQVAPQMALPLGVVPGAAAKA